MMPNLDETHDPELRSWLESANLEGAEFPIQNLPLGVFRVDGGPARVGCAIGDWILDIVAVTPFMSGDGQDAAEACRSDRLNGLMALGRQASRALRRDLSRLLSDPRRRDEVEPFTVRQAEAEMLPPAHIGDYTDFYASVFHATNVGRLFRPDNPLLPNYKWVPIAYHGRASSIVVSGTGVRRPSGQVLPPGESRPVVRPSRSLDYELELGAFIGSASRPGAPIPIEEAREHLFGVCLLNDWSARDIQAWEYQPLGPFLSKNFATTISPWIVTAEALEPFRRPPRPRPEGDPEPLPYLSSPSDQAEGAYGIAMEALVSSARMRAQGLAPVRLSVADASDLYWTLGQMIAHHASGGCALSSGDLLGSGTVSGPERRTAGCLLEITARGAEPVELPTGEARSFLEDGDEVILKARCERDGFVGIGLGDCRGAIEAGD
jgi:fumarylacetoacetase